jgi:methylthioribulose-1-phosphate dehydratase
MGVRMAGQAKRGGDRGSERERIVRSLCQAGRQFYACGWVFATSGNFSAVVSRAPFRMVITPTGADKGTLTARQMVEVDAAGKITRGSGRPSDEMLLHLGIIRARRAGAVLHTHSIWSTMVSEAYAGEGGVAIEGYEMLKGLAGVCSHEHTEWLPVIDNSQDIPSLARTVEATLRQCQDSHGFLLRRHGLYTWGGNLTEARRHVEIFEFLLEVIGRYRPAGR